jgi:dissimilatory sulfite reductase (desulfoviridin) alpha/beta subunit
MLEFEERSLKVTIDDEKCKTCQTKACAEACAKYARGILQIDSEGRASLGNLSKDEVLRLGTECLACEFACKVSGNDAIKIDVPIKGLDDYLAKRGLG